MRGGAWQFENNYFTEMCSGSEAGSYSRLIDCVYHSTLGVRVRNKKAEEVTCAEGRGSECGGATSTFRF